MTHPRDKGTLSARDKRELVKEELQHQEFAFDFFVEGKAVPQGSMVAGITRAGRPYMRHQNPNLKKWRESVGLKAREAMQLLCPDLTIGPDTPCVLTVLVRQLRPMRQFTARGHMSSCAKPYPVVPPDLDKYARAVGDALEIGGVIPNDSQIVTLVCHKVYCNSEEEQGVLIRLTNKDTIDEFINSRTQTLVRGRARKPKK